MGDSRSLRMKEMPTNLRFSERMAWELEHPDQRLVRSLLCRLSRLRAKLEGEDWDLRLSREYDPNDPVNQGKAASTATSESEAPDGA